MGENEEFCQEIVERAFETAKDVMSLESLNNYISTTFKKYSELLVSV